MNDIILDIKNLVINYETDDGCVRAVSGLDLQLGKKKTLGLVGETGAGKTTTALSILNLVPNPPGVIRDGVIMLDGDDVLKKSPKELEKMRGNDVAMAVSTFRRIKQRPYTAWFTQGFLLYAIINQVNNKKSNTTLLSRAI